MKTIPVIIVGAGPVGLSMALALARQNIRSLVIERNATTTQHPRARGVNVRTMELFRQWGNVTELLKYEQPKEARRFIWAQSLQGEEITRITTDDRHTRAYSPIQSSFVAQDRVEESLYHSLLNYPETEIHFLKEFVSLEMDEKGVTARIINKTNNQEELVRAQYLIAADGAHSSIRKQLGITMEGPENLGQFCSVYCEIDLSQWTKHRPCAGYFFTDKKLSGRFLSCIDGTNRWIVGMRFFPEQSKSDFTDDYCVHEIRRVVDVPHLDVRMINKSFWTMGAQIASHYRKDKVFLVGDAAHRLPPTGGFGMNTGVQDAHNLAWKLAFVIHYNISDHLLDTYYQERAPIAEQNIKWSIENAKRYTEIYEAIGLGDMQKLKVKLQDQHENLNYSGLDLGFIYHSAIIFSENDQTLSGTVSKYVPTSLPGIRAPHVTLLKNGTEISTLDLFEKEFVLLVGSEGQLWKDAAYELANSRSFPLKIYKIAPTTDADLYDPTNIWHHTNAITTKGAVLVRPDGHVAWRSQSMVDQPKNLLNKVFSAVI